MTGYWNPHCHSNYSILDGMTPVANLVRRAAALGYPALGLTDHGNMAGATELYQECKSAGIVPFPGFEGYLIDPDEPDGLSKPGTGKNKAQNYHFGALALTTRGYQGLVKLISLGHTRPRLSKFPRLTLDDLMDFGEDYGDDVALMTGCFFGYPQQLITKGRINDAIKFVDSLADVFPHTYVELQHHNIDHTEDETALQLTDDEMVGEMIFLSDRLGLPVIATADNHYLLRRQKTAHELMKAMVYGSVEDAFPGDSFHLPDEAFVASHYDRKTWDACLDGAADLLSKGRVDIPALNTYTPRVPTISKDAQISLRNRCAAILDDLLEDGDLPARKTNTYLDRLDYELGIIQKIGFANYFLLWDKIVKWCRAEQICIEARGSANGSLVCFLLGITQVDPVKHGVIFDRFLSIDRIKPPDIDMDIEDVGRQRVIAYVKSLLGDAVQIGTWGKLGTSIDAEGDEKGSVLRTFQTYVANQAELPYKEWQQKNKKPGARNLPSNPELLAEVKADKALVYSTLTTMRAVERHFPGQYPALRQLVQMDSVYKNAGVHAGGILLSGDDLKIEDWIPTMLIASSDTTVSQFDMDQVEKWGLLKLDLLGQRSLRIMRLTQEMIGRKDATDFTWIPEDDPEAMKVLRSGQVDNGVFHAEGYTKAKGYREMQPKNIKDVILGTALFMPGAMDTGQKDMYIQRRRHPEQRDKVKYPHQVFKDVLGTTYGALVYQEQTINIMRGLGLDIPTINMMFKIVKDSGKGAVARNAERIKPIRALFDQACADQGVMGSTQAAWDWITGIVAYAFNQAHATGYGIRTYRFAYLKAHYPLEFHTALLQANAGTKKEPIYIREVHRIGIPILPPNVNISGENWTLDSNVEAIRKGLVSITGVGVAAASAIIEAAPFRDVTDLCERVTHRAVSGRKDFLADRTMSGTIRALKDAGAFQGLEKK